MSDITAKYVAARQKADSVCYQIYRLTEQHRQLDEVAMSLFEHLTMVQRYEANETMAK